MYVERDIQVRSCKHCCSGKAISITYSECISVALNIQQEMHMRHIAICGLPRSITFFHITSQITRVFNKHFIQHKMCV
jgi:hypothetical protein